MGTIKAGVENIKLDGSYADGTTSVASRTTPFFDVDGCAFCWFKSVETYDTPDVAKAYPFYVRYSYANEIRDSYIHYGQATSSVVRHKDCNLSSFIRARLTFSKISEAVAVQMNGLGFSLC